MRYIFRAVLIIYGVLAVYAITLSAFMIANMNDAPEKDGSRTVIVLGCQVRRDGPSLMLRRRLDAACSYLSADTKPTASFRAVRAITSISAIPRLCMRHS